MPWSSSRLLVPGIAREATFDRQRATNSARCVVRNTRILIFSPYAHAPLPAVKPCGKAAGASPKRPLKVDSGEQAILGKAPHYEPDCGQCQRSLFKPSRSGRQHRDLLDLDRSSSFDRPSAYSLCGRRRGACGQAGRPDRSSQAGPTGGMVSALHQDLERVQHELVGNLGPRSDGCSGDGVSDC